MIIIQPLSWALRGEKSAEPLDFDWIYTGTTEIIFNRAMLVSMAANTKEKPFKHDFFSRLDTIESICSEKADQ